VQESESDNAPETESGDVQINVLDSDWTVVLRKKGRKNRLKDNKNFSGENFYDGSKWCPVWKRNFARYGDTYKTVYADFPTPVQADQPPVAQPLPDQPGDPVPAIVVYPPPDDSDSDQDDDVESQSSTDDSQATVLLYRDEEEGEDDFETCDEDDQPPTPKPKPGTSRIPGVADLKPRDVGKLRKLLGEPRALRSQGKVLSPDVLRKYPESRTRKKKK